jgi:hypothetical protein
VVTEETEETEETETEETEETEETINTEERSNGDDAIRRRAAKRRG